MNPPKVALIPMQCVRCQSPLLAQPDEVFWVCSNCGQGQLLSDEQGLAAQPVHYSAGLTPGAKGKPVWVAAGQAALQRESYSLFDSKGEMQEFWSQPRWFFIPAYALELEQLIETGVKLLRQPSGLQEGGVPAVFHPVIIHPEDVKPLAEFIVLAVEAERRDSLKKLDFTLQLANPELWIMP